MPSQQDFDKTFWLAYCDAIRTQIGTDFGPKTSIYYASKAQRGPPAGPLDLIDPIYANLGIYELGDNLLDDSNLFYIPSEANSFARSLLAFMEHVELGANPKDAVKLKLAQDTQNEATAKIAFDREDAAAKAEFKKWKTDPDFYVPGTTWAQWKSQNAKSLNLAEANWNAAGSQLDATTRMAYGDMSNQYLLDKQRIRDAINNTAPLPDINMPCTTLSAPDADAILRNVQAKTAAAKPVPDSYRPAYSASTYADQVTSWLGNVGNTNTKRSSVTFSFDKGNKVDEKSFKHTSGGGGISFNYAPWLSVGISASADHQEQSILSTSDQQKTTLTMFWDQDMRKIEIKPGKWDIKGASAYKLKSTAPPEVKGLSRVVQFVIASNLGFEVQFDGAAVSEFDKAVSDTVSAGGSLRLFGIPISVSASGSSTSADTTHSASWDKQSGKLTIAPSQDGGFATVMAVIGEKVNAD